MLILGMDTSTAQVAVAVGGEAGVLAEVRLTGGRRHAEQLAPAVEYVLREAGVDVRDVDAFALGIGPGLFTGLRVGLTTAKVMAASLGRPVVPVSSLELVALPVRHVTGVVVAVTDARRSEVYRAAYRAAGGRLEPLAAERVAPPDVVASEVEAWAGEGETVLLVGNGSRLLPESLLTRPGIPVAPSSFDHPSPRSLVEVAVERCADGQWVEPGAVEPLYLRKSDAEMQWSGSTS